MIKRLKRLWPNGILFALSLLGFIYALVDPADRQSHLRASIYGAMLVVMCLAFFMSPRGEI
jgi:hypothetical protein